MAASKQTYITEAVPDLVEVWMDNSGTDIDDEKEVRAATKDWLAEANSEANRLAKSVHALPKEAQACLKELREAGVVFQHSSWDYCPMAVLSRAKALGPCDIEGTKKAVEQARKGNASLFDNLEDTILTAKETREEYAEGFLTGDIPTHQSFDDWASDKYSFLGDGVQDSYSAVSILTNAGLAKITAKQMDEFISAWDEFADFMDANDGQSGESPRAIAVLDTILGVKVKAKKSKAKSKKKN